MILTLSLRMEGAYERPVVVSQVSDGMSLLVWIEVDLGPCDVVPFRGIAEAQLPIAERCF